MRNFPLINLAIKYLEGQTAKSTVILVPFYVNHTEILNTFSNTTSNHVSYAQLMTSLYTIHRQCAPPSVASFPDAATSLGVLAAILDLTLVVIYNYV